MSRNRGGALLDPPREAATTTITLVCAGCGYGIAIRREPPPCPMCRGTEWEPAPWRPFTSLEEVTILRAGAAARRAATSD